MTNIIGASQAALVQYFDKLKELNAETSRALIDLEAGFIESGKLKLSDPIDQASQREERDTVAAQISRHKMNLKHINRALARGDDYGFCVECDTPINPKRLEFNPALITCVDCQSLLDDMSK